MPSLLDIDYRAAADSLVKDLTDTPPTVLPPLSMMQAIGSPMEEGYVRAMRTIAADIIVKGSVEPTSAMLDIGCGCGRLATAFARYLTSEGSYIGLDVWDEGIAWCRNNITSLHSNFRFCTVQASDDYYHLKTAGGPNRFDLSFVASNSIDCAFAISLFTHLKLEDARQYFQMIARTLKPGGRAYLTFFVIDEHVQAFVGNTGRHKGLSPAGNGMWYGYPDAKYRFFAGFEEHVLRAEFEACGLQVVNQGPGAWAQKPGGQMFQDWFVVQAPAALDPARRANG